MIYTKTLPRVASIMHLAEISGPFPARRSEISTTAWRYGFNSDVLDFLELFPENEIFSSRDDFAGRCEELLLLMRQEEDMDAESSLSSQD